MIRLLIRGLMIAAVLALAGCVSGSSSSKRSSGPEGERTQQQKGSDINVQLAIGYMREGRTELALDKINRAVAQNPRSAEAHSVAGVINESIGRFDVAQDHYERSARLDPENGDVLNNYGQFLCKTEQVEEAIRYFTLAMEQPFYDTPEVALGNACFCYYKAHRFEEAEPLCRRAIDTNDQFPDAYFILAAMFLEREDAMRARAFLQRYESIGADTPASLKLCIDIETKMGAQSAVDECARRLKDQFPDSSEAKTLEGRASNG